MGFLFLTLTSLVPCIFGQANTIAMEEFSLIKRNEIYYYRPKHVGSPWSSIYRRPLFSRLSTGETFFVEVGGSGERWMAYFFSQKGDLNRLLMLNPPGAKGKPGHISGVTTVFANSNNEFGSLDNSKRLNLWNHKGDLNSSILLPLTVNDGLISTASFDRKMMVLGGQNTKSNSPMIVILDCQDTSKIPLSIHFCEDAYIQAETKGNEASAFVNIYVSILSSGNIAYNVSSSPYIHIANESGLLMKDTTTPPHFQSLYEAESFNSAWFNFDDQGCIRKEADQWLESWSRSLPIYELSKSRLVVPRNLHGQYYLDVYLSTDDAIKYAGYSVTSKQFLYADSSGIYLLEGKDDTSIVVGVYDIITPGYWKEQKVGWSTMRLKAEKLTGIRKVKPDTSKPCGDCDREKRRPKGYRSNIKSVKLIDTDSVKYSLIDSLDKEKNHILVFGAPQDCSMYSLLESVEEYVEDKPDFDVTIIYTHSYPEELKEFIRLSKTQIDYPIYDNIDKKTLYPILSSQVCFLVVSKDGTIQSSADFPRDYPDFEPKPREKK